jgi:hypothetical protein
MNKGPIVLALTLLLAVTLALPPVSVSAWGGRGGGGRGAMGHGGVGGRGGFRGHVGGSWGRGGGHLGHRGFRRPFVHGRPFFGHRFNRVYPFGAFAYPLALYGWPGAYGWPYFWGSALDSSYGEPAAYSPSVAYASVPAPAAPTVYTINVYNPPPAPQPAVQPVIYEPPPAPAVSAAPSRPQDVVEYDGGRYELRGDGIAVPYRWVWIPNPPPGPPGSSSMRAPAGTELAPARRGTLYRWLDDEGVLHVTDRWQVVPLRFREQVKQNLGS